MNQTRKCANQSATLKSLKCRLPTGKWQKQRPSYSLGRQALKIIRNLSYENKFPQKPNFFPGKAYTIKLPLAGMIVTSSIISLQVYAQSKPDSYPVSIRI